MKIVVTAARAFLKKIFSVQCDCNRNGWFSRARFL